MAAGGLCISITPGRRRKRVQAPGPSDAGSLAQFSEGIREFRVEKFSWAADKNDGYVGRGAGLRNAQVITGVPRLDTRLRRSDLDCGPDAGFLFPIRSELPGVVVECDLKLKDSVFERVSRIVNSEPSQDEMLGQILGLTAQVSNCDACLVYLMEFA